MAKNEGMRDLKFFDNQNRTGKPYSIRPDLEDELNETQQDAYLVEENDGYEGESSPNMMPKNMYPTGKVPQRVWNRVRPHRAIHTLVTRNRDTRNSLDG